MPRSRTLNIDTDIDLRRIFHPTEDGNGFTIETRQNVEDLVEQNKALANEAVAPGSEMRRVASIPLGVFFDLQRRGITRDPVAFKKWLNDRDNRFFRTTPEQL